MRSQASDEPFQEYLKYGCRNQAVKQAKHAIVDIPERTDTNLHKEDNGDGNESSEQSSRPDWDNLMAQRVGKLRVDDLTTSEIHREGS